MYTPLFIFAPFFSFFIKWFWNSEFRIRRDKSFTNSSCYTMSQSPRKSFCNDRDILLSFFSSLKYQDIDNFRIISDWKKDKELFSLFQTLREAFRVSKIRMDDDTFEMGRIKFQSALRTLQKLYQWYKKYVKKTMSENLYNSSLRKRSRRWGKRERMGTTSKDTNHHVFFSDFYFIIP